MFGSKKYKVTVPIDASEGHHPGERAAVRVAAIDAQNNIQSHVVDLSKRHASATFEFDEAPNGLEVIVGPAEASHDELLKLQTLRKPVSRSLLSEGDVTIDALRIPAGYLERLFRWCSTFTISGQVLCPDGRPVPGAQVCASDVAWLPPWSGTQLLGCATTDINGWFNMSFTFCCRWEWWWWMMLRTWRVDTTVANQLIDSLVPEAKFRPIKPPGPQPDPAWYEQLLGVTPDPKTRREQGFHHARLEALRQPMQRLLEPSAAVSKYWPWWPWWPWLDCNPDVIFRVTQFCNGQEVVILDEQAADTRWDIPTNLNVTLLAGSNACCLPDPSNGFTHCCDLEYVCNVQKSSIGTAADGVFEGYAYQPTGNYVFAGVVNISGTAEAMGGGAPGTQIDYYEFSWARKGSANPMTPIPIQFLNPISKDYLTFDSLGNLISGTAAFVPSTIDGHVVYPSLDRYCTDHGLPLSSSGLLYWMNGRDLLLSWRTDLASWFDDVYTLQAAGYTESAGLLTDAQMISCDGSGVSTIELRLDNRFDNLSGHPHPCGSGTVHTCTTEPDSNIDSVVVTTSSGTTAIAACGKFKVADVSQVVITFLASDSDGHLADYSLVANYGQNASVWLLHLGVNPAVVGSTDSVGQSGSTSWWTYLPDGVTPHWYGGQMSITLTGAALAAAFPIPCCYELELIVRKRVIVNCNTDYENRSHYTFMVE